MKKNLFTLKNLYKAQIPWSIIREIAGFIAIACYFIFVIVAISDTWMASDPALAWILIILVIITGITALVALIYLFIKDMRKVRSFWNERIQRLESLEREKTGKPLP